MPDNSVNKEDERRKNLLAQLNKKSVGTAYLWWIFGGVLGLHRLYLKMAHAILTFVLGLVAALFASLGTFSPTMYMLAGILLVPLSIQWFCDAFRIPKAVADYDTLFGKYH